MADERGFLYHPVAAPGGKLFHTQAERDALPPDWVDTPTKFLVAVVLEALVDDQAPDPDPPNVKRGPGRPRKDAVFA